MRSQSPARQAFLLVALVAGLLAALIIGVWVYEFLTTEMVVDGPGGW